MTTKRFYLLIAAALAAVCMFQLLSYEDAHASTTRQIAKSLPGSGRLAVRIDV